MFFAFSKDIKSQFIESDSPAPKKRVKSRPTWTDSDESRLNYLRMRAEDAHDQMIWIHNQISYFSYEVRKSTDEHERAENQSILSSWNKRMTNEEAIFRQARQDMQPLLEKKERFEDYDEDEDEDDE